MDIWLTLQNKWCGRMKSYFVLPSIKEMKFNLSSKLILLFSTCLLHLHNFQKKRK
jgi:hypothetical protein